jgi:hypothetical protein
MGSLEAYLAAALFAAAGAGDVTLRLPALAFSVLFVGAVYVLGRELYGRRVALLAGAYVALGPAVLVIWGLAAGAGYIEVMAIGTVLLVLAARYPALDALPARVAALMGLLMGCGLWLEPLMVDYLVPLCVVYAARLAVAWRTDSTVPRRAVTPLAVMALGAVAGAAPLLAYNLAHGWETVRFIVGAGTAAPRASRLAVAAHLLPYAAPVLLGLAQPTSYPAVFARWSAHHAPAYWAGVALATTILGVLVLSRRGLVPRLAALAACRNSAGTPPCCTCAGRDAPLVLCGFCVVAVYVLSRFGFGSTVLAMPRYLLPLYTLTPLVVDAVVPRRSRRARAAVTALAVALLAANAAVTRATPLEHLDGPPIAAFARVLEARGIRIAYVDYWIAYRLSFESHERILGIPARDAGRFGRVRLTGYLAAADRAPAARIAWLFPAGSPGDAHLRALLARAHVGYRRTVWQREAIYDHLSRPVRASGPCLGGSIAVPCR